MYAIIDIGGKQERVSIGDVVRVERLEEENGSLVDLESVLVVDGDDVRVMPDDLREIRVSGVVVGEELGEKIRGFTYKPKTRSRRHYGHRQMYSLVQIESISGPGIHTNNDQDSESAQDDNSDQDGKVNADSTGSRVDTVASTVTVVDGDGD